MDATQDVRLEPVARRPWLAFYPPEVPAEIDGKPQTLSDMILDAVATHATRPAFESFGHRLTFAEIGAAARAFAGWLQAQGLRKGDRVALMMPNVMAYPAAMFGTLIGGFVVVNINPLYTARELTHQMADSGAKVIVVLENFAHVVEEARAQMPELRHVVVASPGDLLGLKGLLVNLVSRHVHKAVKPFSLPGHVRFSASLGEKRSFAKPDISADDIAFLQYTGGTTGVAKGAMLLHRNVDANVKQCALWFGPIVRSTPEPVMVTALPLYHIFALTCCCLYIFRAGACGLLIANPRDIASFVKTLKSRPFTMISGVNTLYNALSHAPGIQQVDFSQLVFSVSGGMATQAAVARAWRDLTGSPIVEGYGLSETSPVVTINRPDIEAFTGSIGYPVPSTDVVIKGPNGDDLPYGEPGELSVKGPQVMAGYWQRPQDTAAAMTADGYFRTGDVAVMSPQGEIRIVDRMKDMILVSGFNVYPNEVEAVIAGHPGVAEVAVIGRDDPQSGEIVVAYVVKRDPALSVDDLRGFCRGSLTGYKVPKVVLFRDSLPKTNVGKVLRRSLREEDARLPR